VQFEDGDDAARVRVEQREQALSDRQLRSRAAERDTACFRAAARNRDARVGVYGSVERPGVLRVGVGVSILD
jgi:hypothetical protein